MPLTCMTGSGPISAHWDVGIGWCRSGCLILFVHPKAVLLSAREQATLFVGSGNMGFGGWRENGEVWAEFKLNEEDRSHAPVFAYFREYLTKILDYVDVSETVQHDVEDAFGADRKQWVSSLKETGGLIGKAGARDSLIDQLMPYVGEDEADRIWVCAPYFDETGKALEEWRQRFSAPEVIVLLQEGETNFTQEAALNLSKGITLRTVDYTGHDDKPRFLHAKFYGIERGDRVTVVLGSANCSNAAWTIPGNGGNAELAAVQELTKKEFRQRFLNELKISKRRPKLERQISEDAPLEISPPALKVLAARYSGTEIRVGFRKHERVEIKTCEINDQAVDFQLSGDEELLVRPIPEAISAPKHFSLRLRGEGPDGEVTSNVIWLDHEFELRASSKQRSLVETIHQGVREGTWGLPAFNDILKLLQDHLDYLTPHGTSRSRYLADETREAPATVRFTRADVFSDGFGILSGSSWSSMDYPQSRIDGLRGLLLRYFGFGWIAEEEQKAPEPEDADEDTHPVTISLGSSPSGTKPPPPPVEDIEKERQKMIGLLQTIVSRISDETYLTKRPPELISKDLAIIAILTASAVKEKWLPDEEYFDLTHRVWHLAFFKMTVSESDSRKRYHGYIDRLYQESDDPERFVESLASVDFAAAMAVWALATQSRTASAKTAQLTLIQVSAIARFPWLWRTDSAEELVPKIRQLLAHTKMLAGNDERAWQQYLSDWKRLVRRGHAIRLFQETFKELQPHELKGALGGVQIRKGELLWQGRAGLCVAQEDCLRVTDSKEKVDVLCLQSEAGDLTKTFLVGYLIPVGELLKTEVAQRVKPLPEAVPRILSDFVTAIVAPLAQLTEEDLL